MNDVDTRRITDRRAVHLATMEDFRAEVRRIAEAERQGRVRRSGNWTVPVIFNHLAAWMEYPFDGYPGKGPPWFVRILGRLMKHRVFKGPMRPGFRLPGVPGGTLGIEDGPLDRAESRVLAAIDRLNRQAPSAPNPVFGPLTHDEWKKLNLGHGELHLSFLHPE